jgi:hypothetical protein
MTSYRTALAARFERETLAAGRLDLISAAEPIRFKDAKFRLGVGFGTLRWWIQIGRLQTVNVGARRLIVIPPSVRIIPPTPEKQHRLPELHRLIDRIRPCYPEDTIAALLAIVAAAETRLIERGVT